MKVSGQSGLVYQTHAGVQRAVIASDGRDILELGTAAVEDASATSSADDVVKMNASGKLNIGLGVPSTLYGAYEGVAATGAGDQNLITKSIPAGALGTTRGFRFECSCRRTTGTGGMTFRIKYGSTTIASFASTTRTPLTIRGTLFNAAGLTNVQVLHAGMDNGTFPITGSSVEDSTGALDFKIDVDLGTDSDVVTVDWFDAHILTP